VGQGSLATLNSVDWDSTLDSIPDRVSDTATTGLNLTDTYIGYYDGTDFKTYIQSNGNFHFGGAANNFIDFNGTQLVIDTDNFSVDGAGNATFSGSLDAAGGVLGDKLSEEFVEFNAGVFTIGAAVKMSGGRIPYFGFVTSLGSLTNGPSGWSASKTATGRYRITHNFAGSSQLNTVVLISPFAVGGSFVIANVVNYFNNYFDVAIVDASGSSYIDTPFNISVVKTV
jgi:hypothetical protein